MSIKKLDAKIQEIRSQSDDKFGLKLGGSLFECLEQQGRLSASGYEGIPNDPRDPNLQNVIDIKILDNEFSVLKLGDDSCSIEIAPYYECLLHANID
ncbi:hypothetical protein A1507_08955 [Methylomonas koyamae]|uniref:Uncharacterized protein n=1 Tax=Methylomonas koyamae TaxID=702114 RepID=A0A177NMR4_9GAMM|nr:hypothetical protein [Methylomonas koyamae]OAI18479.1 hypothetical protein A1507_08955 [Methylomonas koyamae]